nr:hypothetical protein [uncultured Mediterranean phage uvMED]
MLLDKDFVMQGGVRNYLGKTEEVKAPKFWQSSKDSPPTELVYITEAEKGLLTDANLHGSLKNGKPNVGASGLLSYDGFGSTDPGQNRAGGDVSNTMDRGGNDGNDRMGSSSGGGESFRGTSPNPKSPPGVTPTRNYTDSEIEKGIDIYGNTIKDTVDKRSSLQKGVDSFIDFYKKGGILGAIGEKLSPMSKALQQKAMEFGLNTKINRLVNKSGSTPRENNIIYQNELNKLRSDLDAVRSGEYTQTDYTSDYGSGDTTNPLDANFNPNSLTSDEQQGLQNLFTPELTYLISGQNPQESIVNKYFANMGSNLGVSSAYMDTYNSAKNKISQTLNLTPNNQQFGYVANPYPNYSMSMTTANPFYDELNNQGLI